jgi:predicted site-specific integrase-resolvase
MDAMRTNEANDEAAREANDGAKRTMSTGEAARLLGVSRKTVRRWATDGEISFVWTSPHSTRTDRHGRRLRGHRRLDAAEVETLARAQRTSAEDQRKPAQ